MAHVNTHVSTPATRKLNHQTAVYRFPEQCENKLPYLQQPVMTIKRCNVGLLFIMRNISGLPRDFSSAQQRRGKRARRSAASLNMFGSGSLSPP